MNWNEVDRNLRILINALIFVALMILLIRIAAFILLVVLIAGVLAYLGWRFSGKKGKGPWQDNGPPEHLNE